MGNQENRVRRAKKRSYRIKYNLMMEVMRKRKRYSENSSNEGEPSNAPIISHEHMKRYSENSLNKSKPSNTTVILHESKKSETENYGSESANKIVPESLTTAIQSIDDKELLVATSPPAPKQCFVRRR